MSEQNDPAPEQSSNRQTSEQPSDRAADARPWLASRRRVLQGAAAAGGLAAFGSYGLAQEAQAIELGGVTSGWEGRAPPEIEGQTNPTLQLTEGQTYELTWENVDGLPHNVVIVGSDGEEIERTEIISGEGETQTLEFEATSDMAEYLCEVHPNTMRGDVEVGSGGGGEQEQQAAAFFEEGTEIGVRTVAEGMTAPTDFAVAGDGRMFVSDQTGEVWVVDSEGGRQDEPFLDVSDRMVTLGEFNGQYADPQQDYDERGLLGIEMHPDFSENGRFFVHYSAPPNEETPQDWDHVEVVSEFAAADMSSADPGSERVLMEFQSPQYNHNAGPIAFGPDGYLYVPMGDGGGANDDMYGHVDDWYGENAGGNGQDVSENLLGSVLRVDVDQEGQDRPYGIPEDNPLVGVDGALDEQYAWGFRNPFGISFDSDGRMFVSDAGQDLFEEANIVEAGGNYGWNVKEGTHCFSTESPGDPPEDCPDSAPDEAPYDGQELQDPIVEYPHVYEGQSVGITVVGGHVYEAGDVEGLDGKYIFGDWANDPARQESAGRIFAAADPEAGGGGATAGDGEGAADNATTGNESAMNETTGNATSTIDNESATNETTDGEEVAAGNKTVPDMNETDGNETMDDESATNESSGPTTEEGDTTMEVPRDELWDMEELVVANSEDGSLGHFVRQFGQDEDGGVYVLANREGVPTGDTGVVMEIVPPEEGEGPPTDEGTGEEEVAEEEPTKGTDDSAANASDGGEQADGNQSADNETGGDAQGAGTAADGNATDA